MMRLDKVPCKGGVCWVSTPDDGTCSTAEKHAEIESRDIPPPPLARQPFGCVLVGPENRPRG